MLWNEIFELALANGLWAVLFLWLFFYQIKDSRKREEKFMAIIDSLADSLEVVHSLDLKMDNIKRLLDTRAPYNKRHKKMEQEELGL